MIGSRVGDRVRLSAVGAAGYLFCAAASAAETEISYQQLREYLAQPDVHAFVQHAIAFESTRYYRVTGTRGADGSCRFQEVLQGRIGELSATRNFGSVDLARQRQRCEKVVERGYYAVSGPVAGAGQALSLQGRTPVLPAAGARKDWSAAQSVPLDITDLDLGAAEVVGPVPLAAETPTLHSAGVYTEWNYGNTPALGGYGSSLITSSIDSSVQVPSDICQLGGQYAWNTKYTFNPLLGYVIDAGYNNRASITMYCHSVCSYTGCRYDWGYAQNSGYYRVRNPGLLGQGGPSTVIPLCVNPVFNTYEPNSIRVYTYGTYQASVNTYWSGWALGCGEFLQSFSSVHTP